MNGFTLIKESYKKLLEQGEIDVSEVKKKIRIYEFLEICDKDDFCILADSSAFNDIIRAYCKIAIEQGNTDGIFDMSADEVLNY